MLIDVICELALECLKALLVVHLGKEWMLKYVINRCTLVLVFFEATVDEVLEVSRPALVVDASMILILDGLVQLMELFALEGWRTSGQLECIAPIAPYIDLFTVRQA